MGVTKTDLYTDHQIRLAALAKVLGHPARITILQYLLKMKTCVCGDIVNEIGLSQPTISQHLKELKSIGIIQGTISGTSVCYCINPELFEECKQLFSDFFDLDADNWCNCC